MFGPFYPGDSAVDWVGLTIYHWGVTYPWLENELPVPGEFANVMNATGPGASANYSRWFYPRFCSDGIHNKPLMLAETAALYNTEMPGGNELAVKQAWFRQIYNVSGGGIDGPDVAAMFPKMKCVNWFDHHKRESEAQNQFIDWRASANPLVRSAFVGAVRTLRNGQPYFLTAQEFNSTQAANSLVAADVPGILPLSGSVTAVLNVKAESGCDLEVDLLDQNFVFKGGTRIPVAAGTSTVLASFALNQPLIDGSQYRWSIFLTPTGGTYLNALTRYKGTDPVARAVTPFLAIQSAPPLVPASLPFAARVKFVAAAEGTVSLTLFNGSHVARGSGTVVVKRGDGLLDVTVIPLAGNPPGSYTLRGSMTGQATVAQTGELPIQIGSAPAADSVALSADPPVVPVGEVFRFTVAYSATTARELRLELSNAVGAIVGSAAQPVGVGSGSIDMTISCAQVAFGAHTARVYVVAPGGAAAQAVASSAVQTLQVVSSGYSQWALACWGVILGNDPIGPELDPDGDGTANGGEYVALTDPRNPASVLRTNLSRLGSQLSVSWASALGRNYQVFSRSNWSSGAWLSLSSVQPGTGGTMGANFNLDSAGALGLYRVQASVP